MIPASLQKFASFRRIVQLFLLLLGTGCTFLATWIFYLQPWLRFTARFDTWLEQNRCLVTSWCESKLLLAQPLGTLFLLGAFCTFMLAIWMEHAMPLRWKTAIDTKQLIFTRLVFLLITIGALLFQVMQLFYYQTPPSGLVWSIGIGALFALGVALDVSGVDWPKTLANLLLVLGLFLLLLGAAGLLLQTVDPFRMGILFAVGGVILVSSSRWATRLGSSFTQGDHLLITLLALAHLGLALFNAWSWHFAFIGDEWGFFETARALNHSATDLKWFELRDSNSFHTVLSMQLQAWVLRLFGEDVAAWRLSAVLPGVFSVPAVYVIGHRLGGRQAALFSAGVFAVSHSLLCFAMIPYNNTQALIPMMVGTALFLFAMDRESSLRYFLVGMVLGLGFIVYGLARLAVIPVGIFWLCHSWPNLRTAFRRLVEIGCGALLVAAPILLNLHSWTSLLKATPVQTEVSAAELSVTDQIVRNVISGFLAILTNPTNSHFVIGPYVDPLTALFVLIGASYFLVTFGRQRTMTAWILGSLLLLIAVSGIQQYSRIATTRMFSVVGIFAVYAGLGSTTLFHFLLPNKRWLHYGSIALILVAITLINQYHITHVTLPNSEKPDIPLIVQQFQESAAADGRGMPVFVIEQNPANSILKLILQAYQIPRERVMLVNADEALQIRYLCDVGQSEAMLIMSVTTNQSAEIRNRIASCWPGYQETPLYNRAAEVTLHRFTSAAAQQALQLAPAERSHERVTGSQIAMRGARALAMAPDGALFVLSSVAQKVWRYAPDGQASTVFSIQQRNPTALVVNQKGEIIVAGGEEKLVWYDTQGNVLQRSSAVKELHRPFGLVVINENELMVSDLDRRQLAHLSAEGHLLETIALPEIAWPSALALTPDQQSLWIYDAQLGMLTEMALATHTVVRQINAHQIGAEENVALAVLPNQNLLQTLPDQRRLLEINPTGEVVRTWSGFDLPTALAVTAETQIFVLEHKLEEVHLLPALYATAVDLEETATVRSQQASDKVTTGDSPLSPLPTPNSK